MKMLGLSLAYLRASPLPASLNLLLMALGIATITVLLLFGRQFEDRLGRDAGKIDLVVGAKGSPIQLILSAVYHVDVPTGNVPLTFARQLNGQPSIGQAVPISLGDNFEGFRVVGTEPEFLGFYDATLAQGTLWSAAYDAVLGAAVAQATGLGIGGEFESVHGVEEQGPKHVDRPYRVTGVLRPTGTVVDRLVLTSLDTVWAAHDPTQDVLTAQRRGTARPMSMADLEVTAVLIRLSSPVGTLVVPRQINDQSPYLAAVPAQEITRLLSLVGIGLDALQAFGLLLVVTAALSVFIALYNAMQERRYDLAIIRTLGARPLTLFLQVLSEGMLLSLAGALVGLLLAHGVLALLAATVPQADTMNLSGTRVLAEEAWLLALALGVGFVSSVLPAVQAYRTDIAAVLARR